MASQRCFDRYVMVDWSARSVPTVGRDSIWIAELDGRGDGPVSLSNPPTRRAAERALVAIVAAAIDARERVLIGVDFALGYPAGTAEALGLDPGDAGRWRATWALIESMSSDDEQNRNDRFAVAAALNRRIGEPAPFWGRPAHLVADGLGTHLPRGATLPRWRQCEQALRARGFRPSSVWQLLGAGSVGGQALTGLPVAARLVTCRPDHVTVWPFDTGFAVPAGRPRVTLAEIWPTPFGVDLAAHAVRDAAQVHHVVATLDAADRAGRLAGWFAAPGEPSPDAATLAAALDEEGWILTPRDASRATAEG